MSVMGQCIPTIYISPLVPIGSLPIIWARGHRSQNFCNINMVRSADSLSDIVVLVLYLRPMTWKRRGHLHLRLPLGPGPSVEQLGDVVLTKKRSWQGLVLVSQTIIAEHSVQYRTR